ncbi:MAG TPA: DUF4202 domain-containing protein [Polyangiaceae bacterium]|jgi:hypothetical protein|nr:DUF4202 domain-containing protein [Polyangiaceae bacterium]
MERFDQAVAEFDRANSGDPVSLNVDGVARPRELVQAERLSAWVARLRPDAPEALRLAARCQHIQRWEIPRSTYPDGRIGYLEWRKALSRFHADRSSEILRHAGYDDETIERVRTINQKRGIKQDADVQTIEDALCLAFLENELDDFADKHPREKVIDILQKSWRKMSSDGQRHALGLALAPRVAEIVKEALAG